MPKRRIPPFIFVLFCLSIILIAFSAAKWIETDGGNILVHKIDIEVTETTYTDGKLYRPISAQSLNQRPAIILISGMQNDKDTMAPLAIELASRGFVALTVDNFGQGDAPARNITRYLNVIDSSLTLLKTQTFVDADRIGIVGYSIGSIETMLAAGIKDINSIVLISPYEKFVQAISTKISILNPLILKSGFEEFQLFRETAELKTDTIQTGPKRIWIESSHFLMPVQPKVLENTLNWFYSELKIPNDIPLWFTSGNLLSPIREFCLLIGFFFLVIILIPVSDLLQAIPLFKFNRSNFTESTGITSGKGTYWVWIVTGLFLFIYSFALALSGLELPFFSGYLTANGLLIWTISLTLVSLFILILRSVRKKLSIFSDFSLNFIGRSVLFSFLLFCLLYSTVWVFSRIFMVETHFITPLFRPLQNARFIPFIIAFFVFSLFFWAFSRLFFPIKPGNQGSLHYLTVGIGCLLLFILFEYIPLILTNQSGWEWLESFFSASGSIPSFVTNFNQTGWGICSSMAIYGTLLLGLLFSLQTILIRHLSNYLPAAMICGGLFAWLVVSGTTIL
ncbi:MAG: alpha/beta hydrolase [Flexilinea sp.]